MFCVFVKIINPWYNVITTYHKTTTKHLCANMIWL